MFKSKKIIITAIVLLLLLPAAYIDYAAASNGNVADKPDADASAAAGYNSLSKYNISHRLGENELKIDIKGNFGNEVDAFIDSGRLIIKNNNDGGAQESYALPAAVNENGVKTEIRQNHITITAPLIKKGEQSGKAIKARIDRMKKWHSLDKDIDSLFDFDNDFFSNDEVFGKNFFNSELERINRQVDNMIKMQRNLQNQMQIKGFGPGAGAFSSPGFKVSHKIENGSVVVSIEGNNLNNLEFKAEDNIFKIHNKVSSINEESSENQISRMNFHSSFAESFTLPARVDSAKMKIDRFDNKIIVTLPIAR